MKHSLDMNIPHILQRQCLPVFHRHSTRAGALKVHGQIGDIDKIAGSGNQRAGYGILEFTHIAYSPAVRPIFIWGRRAVSALTHFHRLTVQVPS